MDEKVNVYGVRIMEERKKLSLSQQEIADKTDIPLSTYKLYEAEKSKIPLSRIEVIADYFNKPVEFFIKRYSKVISVMLHKGGCGKTTTTVNLSYALAEKGYKVLCIDTDMQMNMSRQYGFTNPAAENFETVLKDKCKLKDAILKTKYPNIDFVTGAFGLATMESDLITMSFREFRVKNAIDPIKSEYDFILLDTNPTLGMLNTSILYASDEIILPVMPTDFGMAGLEVFANFYFLAKKEGVKANILGILLNNIDFRKGITSVVFERLEKLFGQLVFNNFISTDANIDNAQIMQQPVLVYQPRTKASKDYRNVAQEIIDKLDEVK